MLKNVRIVVVGDGRDNELSLLLILLRHDILHHINTHTQNTAKVGKTSLIRTLVSEHFASDGDETLDSWLREVNIAPDNMGTEKVSLTIVDTPSFSWRNAAAVTNTTTPQESEDHAKKKNAVCREIASANVVVLVYDVNRNSTFLNIKRHWLPLIRDDIEGPSKPIVLVGNKLDLQPKFQMRRYSAMTQRYAPILKSFKMVDACVECSCKNLFNIQEVFYYARKAVIYPVKPLYDLDGRKISMRQDFQRALRRCFRIFDRDRDNLWCNAELRKFQSMIFDTNLQDADIDGVHKVLSQKEGDNIKGTESGKGRALTLDGFLCLNRIFLERNLDETSWLVLRALNYKVKSPDEFDELELETPQKIFELKSKRDTSIELTQSGISFFDNLFTQFDSKEKGILTSADIRRVFDICPKEYRKLIPVISSLTSSYDDDDDNVELSSKENDLELEITRGYWTALWSALTLLRPDLTQRYLFYLGYNLPVDDISQALRVTRSRAVEFEKNSIKRNVLRVFVFGRKSVGKTTLLGRVARPAFGHPLSKTKDSGVKHYVGSRKFMSKKVPLAREGTNEDDTLLVFTEFPHLAIARGLEAGRSLNDVLNEIEDGTLCVCACTHSLPLSLSTYIISLQQPFKNKRYVDGIL